MATRLDLGDAAAAMAFTAESLAPPDRRQQLRVVDVVCAALADHNDRMQVLRSLLAPAGQGRPPRGTGRWGGDRTGKTT